MLDVGSIPGVGKPAGVHIRIRRLPTGGDDRRKRGKFADPVQFAGFTVQSLALPSGQGYGRGVKIQAAGRIRHPDAFIVCSPVPSDAQVIRDPVIVFEVLSPSTSDKDRFEKNRGYRDTPSSQRYGMLEQSSAAATVFCRNEGDWVGQVLPSHAVLALPEVGIERQMAELYEGMTFAPDSAEALAG
jgi:Uma2 family endonuclease